MIQLKQIALMFLLGSLTFVSHTIAWDGAIDTADPTRIYTGVGISVGSSDYENGESRRELRGSFSWALTADDMMLLESGYGRHESATAGGDETGLTRTRLFYRQRLPFDDSLQQGFRGMAFQVELQLSGELKGTDGQTILSGGGTPAIRVNKYLDIYPVVDLISSFDKNFKNFNGIGFEVAPLFSYAPDYLWPGAVLQVEPSYTQYVIGQFAFGNSRNLRVAGGGTFFGSLSWLLSAEKHAGRDLLTYRGDNSAGLKHDWSAAFRLLATF